jgi:hypothetical protein
VSSGYDQTMGFINDEIFFPSLLCMGIMQEFGTRTRRCRGVDNGECGTLFPRVIGEEEGLRRYLTWAFYPHRNSWRRKALREGIKMLHAILKY